MRYQVVKTYCCEVEAEDSAQALDKADHLFSKDPSSFVTIDVDPVEDQ